MPVEVSMKKSTDFSVSEFGPKWRQIHGHKQIKNSSWTKFPSLVFSADVNFKLLVGTGISKSLFWHFAPHLCSVMKMTQKTSIAEWKDTLPGWHKWKKEPNNETFDGELKGFLIANRTHQWLWKQQLQLPLNQHTHLFLCLPQEPRGEQCTALSKPDRSNFSALPEHKRKKASTQKKCFCWLSVQSMLTSLFVWIHWSVWVWLCLLKAEFWGRRSSEPVLLCSPERDWTLALIACVALEVVSCWPRAPPTDSPTSISCYPRWPAGPDSFLKTDGVGQANGQPCWESEAIDQRMGYSWGKTGG